VSILISHKISASTGQ